MVSFLSLFLGLLIGPHTVELAVGTEVAEVHLVLDGGRIATLGGPPWTAKCDFGNDLRPHELVAIAYDSKGEETGRTRQWVNLPRERAESTLVLEHDGDGRPRALRIFWENLEELHPLAIRVALNGRPLQESESGLYPLPDFDPAQLQVATAEVEFEEGPATRTELVFGGPTRERLEVELTAVPVRFDASIQPTVAALTGKLGRGGEALPVLGVERGRSRVVVVVENRAQPVVNDYALALDHGAGFSERSHLRLQPGESLQAQGTTPERRTPGDTPLDLFTITPQYEGRHGDLAYLLTHANAPPPNDPGPQQLADAVAVAAVQAAAGDRPRAVVLILGHKFEDRSRFDVDEVREFLSDLRVPLLVWATGPRRAAAIPEDRIPLSRRTEWGRVRDISTFFRFVQALNELRRELDRQAVAWVAGAHLPQEIELVGSARDVELAR